MITQEQQGLVGDSKSSNIINYPGIDIQESHSLGAVTRSTSIRRIRSLLPIKKCGSPYYTASEEIKAEYAILQQAGFVDVVLSEDINRMFD